MAKSLVKPSVIWSDFTYKIGPWYIQNIVRERCCRDSRRWESRLLRRSSSMKIHIVWRLPERCALSKRWLLLEPGWVQVLWVLVHRGRVRWEWVSCSHYCVSGSFLCCLVQELRGALCVLVSGCLKSLSMRCIRRRRRVPSDVVCSLGWRICIRVPRTSVHFVF
jgi:hypothetical protein